MNDCPHYYKLVDGREFVDFFHEECIPHLTGVHPSVIHALQSAMEHQFRMGFKTTEIRHDVYASIFWTQKAYQFLRQTGDDAAERMDHALKMEHVANLVTNQRKLKVDSNG